MLEINHDSLIKDAPFGIYRSTIEGRLIWANAALARMFGYRSADDMVQNVTDLASQLFTSPSERTELVDRALSIGGPVLQEIRFRKKDGQTVDAILRMKVVAGMDGPTPTLEGFLEDITERKRLQCELAQGQKLQSIGTLSSGLAHDFNNLLGIVIGNADLIKRSIEDREDVLRRITTIISAAERGTALVKQMLVFVRKSEPTFTAVSMNRILGDVVKMLQETFPKSVRLLCNLTDELPMVNGDPTQIHQVLLNLCVNARDAMNSSGDLILSTEVASVNCVHKLFPTASSPEYVVVGVSDNGVGMPREVLDHIFEPFFTTKEAGKGTGLGLSVVRGIMDEHHGFVNVQSEPGKGTTFAAYFPVYPHLPATGNDLEDLDDAALGGRETILVVEDEEMLSEFVTSILSAKGYKVLRSADGKEAVETYSQNMGRIDLVLSDLGLPKLTGGEVLTWLKEINPGVKFMLATGFIDPEERKTIIEDGAREVVMKPYKSVDLLRKIRKVLDA